MVDGFARGHRRKKLSLKRDSGGRSAGDTGLPVQPFDWEASSGYTDIRLGQRVNSAILASMSSDAWGGSAGSERPDSDEALLGDGGGLRAGGDRNRKDGKRGQQERVRSAGPFELAQLAHVADGYREPVEETTPEVASPGVLNGNAILEANATTLDNLVSKALFTLDEIMDIPLPPRGDESFVRVAAIKKDAAVSVVNSGLKADENRFRKRDNDVLQKLYDRIQAQKLIDITPLVQHPQEFQQRL